VIHIKARLEDTCHVVDQLLLLVRCPRLGRCCGGIGQRFHCCICARMAEALGVGVSSPVTKMPLMFISYLPIITARRNGKLTNSSDKRSKITGHTTLDFFDFRAHAASMFVGISRANYDRATNEKRLFQSIPSKKREAGGRKSRKERGS